MTELDGPSRDYVMVLLTGETAEALAIEPGPTLDEFVAELITEGRSDQVQSALNQLTALRALI